MGSSKKYLRTCSPWLRGLRPPPLGASRRLACPCPRADFTCVAGRALKPPSAPLVPPPPAPPPPNGHALPGPRAGHGVSARGQSAAAPPPPGAPPRPGPAPPHPLGARLGLSPAGPDGAGVTRGRRPSTRSAPTSAGVTGGHVPLLPPPPRTRRSGRGSGQVCPNSASKSLPHPTAWTPDNRSLSVN